MIGAPGVGKGTYSRMLSREFNIKEFSTGDELRKLSSSNDVNPEMNEIKEILRQGIFNIDLRQACRG
jgi:adenylate kinase family enzyme